MSISMAFDKDSNTYIYPCPHCMLYIQVHKDNINCKIFRHATYKKNASEVGQQLNPHASKAECDKLASEGLVYGCAKPYEMYKEGLKWKVRKCGYK
jgi:hypothetical protein